MPVIYKFWEAMKTPGTFYTIILIFLVDWFITGSLKFYNKETKKFVNL